MENPSSNTEINTQVKKFILGQSSRKLSRWQLDKRARKIRTLLVYPLIWDQSSSWKIWEILNGFKNTKVRQVKLSNNINECHLLLSQKPKNNQERLIINEFLDNCNFNNFILEIDLKRNCLADQYSNVALSDKYKVDIQISAPPLRSEDFNSALEVVSELFIHELHYDKSIKMGIH